MKLTLRDFARATKRRDGKAVAAHSSKRLRHLVWDRLPEDFWKIKWPGGASSGSKNSSKGSRAVSVSVRVRDGEATARIRWKGLLVHVSLVKEKGWKIDNLSVRWKSADGDSYLDLTRDVSPILAVYAFATAAYRGNRDQMVRWSAPRLLASGWQKLPETVFERVSARFRAPSKEPSTGSADKVVSVFFRKNAASGRCLLGVTMKSGRHLEVLVGPGKQGWAVEDALLREPGPSGSMRRMRLSHLLGAARALYDLVRKLSGSDLVDFRSLQSRVGMNRAASGRAARPASKSRASGPGSDRTLGRFSEILGSLSLVDFDDTGRRLWVTFSWKSAKGRIDFLSRRGRWIVSDARLDKDGRSIRLSDALGMRDLLVSLIEAALRADVAQIQSLCSPSLNRRVWSRLGPLDLLKKRLLSGGLDVLLGFSVLPKNVFAKLGFGAKIALLARRIVSGRLLLTGLWRDGSMAFLVIRVGTVPVTIRAVSSGGKWLLDDVAWQVGSKRLSLKKRAGDLMEKWSRSLSRSVP